MIAVANTVCSLLNGYTLQTSSSLVYALPSDIENLTFTGTGNFTATGNAANNLITGSNDNLFI
jgi:hypothetical protein